jgi:hypothetical protein
VSLGSWWEDDDNLPAGFGERTFPDMKYIGDDDEEEDTRPAFDISEIPSPSRSRQPKPKRKSLSDWFAMDGELSGDDEPAVEPDFSDDEPAADAMLSRSASNASLDSPNAEDLCTNDLDQTPRSPREEVERRVYRPTSRRFGKLLGGATAVFASNESVMESLKKVAAHVDAHVQEVAARLDRAEELCASGSSVGSEADAAKAEEAQTTTVAETTDVAETTEAQTTDVAETEETKRRERVYKYSKLILRVPDPKTATEGFCKFEDGLMGHLQDLLKDGNKNIDVVCFGCKSKRGKKGFSAPHPDEFAENMKVFAESFNKRFDKKDGDIDKKDSWEMTEGQKHKEKLIDQNRAYARIFDKVMDVSCPKDGPSLEGGLDAVVELLGDVRTSAWNMAAFIFRRE